ncbi:MAG: amidohydrolase family protein [Dehalococcoidia bacterium]
MIVDVHTHMFPPRMIARRGRLVPLDDGFAELYGSAKARMVSAEALLASMDEAGVDVAVVCGFWWRDPAMAEEHAAYLLDEAAASGGRLVPFVPFAGTPPEAFEDAIDRLVRLGARGFGEVRLGQADPDHLETLLVAAATRGLPVLVHASEAAGHAYAGKTGGHTPADLWRTLEAHPDLRVIAAHWGGGFPFFGLMPEVRAVIEAGRLAFDTAATRFLYEPRVFDLGAGLVGTNAVMWGSDFPLRAQQEDRADLEVAVEDEATRRAFLGENAARFLGIEPPPAR